jgi:hypothetical protein
MNNLSHRQNHQQNKRSRIKTIGLIFLRTLVTIVGALILFQSRSTHLLLIGRHDVNAPPPLTEEYFNRLTAPRKELIWFE